MYRKRCLRKYFLDRPGRVKKTTETTLSTKEHTKGIKNKIISVFNHVLHVDALGNGNISSSYNCSSSSEAARSEIQFGDEYRNEIFTQADHNENESTIKEMESHNINVSSLSQKLASWAIESNVSLKDLSKLLKILIEDRNHKNLPFDARTLLKTPRNVSVRSMDNGQYIYLGIVYFLREFFKYRTLSCDTILLSISVDGTPISSSGINSLWIIFGSLHYSSCSRHVLDIDLFFGPGKPTSFNSFMSETVDELRELMKSGYTTVYGRKYDVKLKCVVADAPALACLKYVKCHGGYSACTKCEIKGNFSSISNSVVYSQLDAPLRTDRNFRQRFSNTEHDSHHKSEEHTVFETLPIDMIKDFPLDKIHLVDEGVVKRILVLLTIKVNRQKLPPTKVGIINQRLEKCHHFMPMEFQRRPRSLKYLLKMKAKEFRNFLLYTGPAVLIDIIPKRTYNHFLTLSLAIRILCSAKNYMRYNDYAKRLLDSVLKLFPKIYGTHNVTYNVHGLLHLADDAKRHGPLDSYSSYAFEAHIKQLKRRIRSPNMPLQQFSNRLKETIKFELMKPCENDNKNSDVEYSQSAGENKYHKASFESFTIRTDRHGDNCVMLADRTIIRARYFFKDDLENKKYVMGQKLVNVKPLNNDKCMILFDMLTGDFESQCSMYLTSQIIYKMCYFPYNLHGAKYFLCSLIHTCTN